jgi:hypothetical protein
MSLNGQAKASLLSAHGRSLPLTMSAVNTGLTFRLNGDPFTPPVLRNMVEGIDVDCVRSDKVFANAKG